MDQPPTWSTLCHLWIFLEIDAHFPLTMMETMLLLFDDPILGPTIIFLMNLVFVLHDK
jgi:hypothetical protein